MKIKMSALVSDIRNKLNGSVASKNRYGSYLRNKMTPVNPQTSFQQAARQVLGAISASWRELTQSQRNSWINGAQNFPFTDVFGDVRILSGQALFVKLNANLAKIGAIQITAAPLPVGFAEIAAESLDVTITAGAISALDLGVSLATVPVGFELGVYATPPQTPGRAFVKNQYRFIGAATVAAGDADLLALYSARFGTAASVGERVFVRVALINSTTGQQGVPVEISAFAV